MRRAARRVLVPLIVVLVLGAAGALLYGFLGPERTAAAEPTALVRRGELVEKASASGNVEPHVQVEVKSRTSGEVIEVLVDEGDHVEAGQLLVRLDPVDAERTLRQAEVALTRAQADLAQARAQLSVAEAQSTEAAAAAEVRARGAEMGLVATEERRTSASSAEVAAVTTELRRAQVQSAAAAVQEARLAVDDARRRLDETTIEAPVAGTVLTVAVERGSIVASGITNVAGGTSLMTVADLSDLRVVGDLPEAQVGQVEKGQPVVIRVDAYPERTFEGRVERVSPLGVDTSNVVTFDVEVVVTDHDASLLRSGMSADIEITTERHEGALLVPAISLHGGGTKRFVLLPGGVRQPVRTGATDGSDVVVLEGLEEGQEILGSGRPSKAGDRGRGGPPGLFGPPGPRGKR